MPIKRIRADCSGRHSAREQLDVVLAQEEKMICTQSSITLLPVLIGSCLLSACAQETTQETTQEATPKTSQIEIPQGFTQTKDLLFFKLDEQGSKGTVERVIADFNKYVVGRVPGFTKPATQKSDLVTKARKPFSWDMSLDIIHPKIQSKPRPLVFVIATAENRNLARYQPFQRIFARRGYITAVIDHAYSPTARHFGYNSDYSLDDISGVKAYTAAVRFFRAHAKEFSIDPNRIGGIGHSKGAYGITRLSDPTISAKSKEFEGVGEAYGAQPNPDYPSHIQVGYQSMGNGTRRSRAYVTDNYAPTITAVGKSDKYNQWAAWPDVVTAYSLEHDANWLGIPMLDKGHDMATGFQPDLGYVREEVVEKFFSRYLEPDLPPAVLYVTPFNGKNNENVVKATDPVNIHFAPIIDEASVAQGVRIVRVKTGQEVRGTWKSARKGTFYSFTPTSGSWKGRDYKVIISKTVKSGQGVALDAAVEQEFSVQSNNETNDDAYTR